MHLHTVLLMSGTAVRAIQLLAALSILIVLHEGGHFFFARLFKTRVEKFYLFFDFLFPFSGMLNFSLFKRHKGETEYGIGWFPLGGYVKISGMVDESMDKDALALPPQPWEFRSKKAWQRLFIMLGGIIVNVLLAIFIYAIVFGVYGEEFLPTKNVKYGIMTDSTGRAIGLRNGDMITGVDHVAMPHFNSIPAAIIFHKGSGSIQLSRNGKDTSVDIPFGTVSKIIESEKGSFIAPRVPAVVGQIVEYSQAARLKLQPHDSIIAINSQPVFFYDEFDDYKRSHYGQPMAIRFVRAGKVDSVTAVVSKDSLLGFVYESPERYFDIVKVHYNPIQAIPKGFSYTYEQFLNYMKQFRLIKTGEVKASKSVGGFISFGKIFPAEFDMESFLKLTAFISIILAFMNLLPIPGLDGGYVIFLLFEIVSGRKVSEKVMERATSVGLVLLLALMLYANGMDIFRLFKK